MRKDHKPIPPGQESIGPPVRPVCGAKTAPNSRVSGFLCRIINDVCEGIAQKHEVRSSEEMRHEMEKFNETTDEEMRKKSMIFSFDVVSLYPSIKKSVAVQGIKKLMKDNKMEMRNVDYGLVSKYLAVMMTPEEIKAENLQEVIPKRVKKSKRKLTTNCLLSKKPENEEWIMGRTPTFPVCLLPPYCLNACLVVVVVSFVG